MSRAARDREALATSLFPGVPYATIGDVVARAPDPIIVLHAIASGYRSTDDEIRAARRIGAALRRAERVTVAARELAREGA